jgi:YD repeat-containing protein
LNLHGTPALVASGRRDVHGSPHHTQWMWHSKADNAILVNGEGQIKHSPKATGQIVHFDTSPGVDVVVGEAGESYENLDRWTRRIVFLKDYAIIIHDILEAPEPSTFAWNVHSAAQLAIDGQRLSYRADNGAFELELLHPQALAITQTDQFDPPPADWTNWDLNQWHVTAAADEKVRERQFFAVIRTGDSEATLDMEGQALRVTLPDGDATYTWNADGFTVTRDWPTDAASSRRYDKSF